MSALPPGGMTDPVHGRARELAAARPYGFLGADEAAWLDAHLSRCQPCADIAAELEGQRALFAPARAAMPQAPRDLWARTAAAIEAEGRPRRSGTRRRFGAWAFAPLAGAMVVAIAVGAGLLNGLPARESTSKGDEPDATPIALTASDVTVLSRTEDGRLEFRRQAVEEVCPLDAASCGLSPSPEITRTGVLDGADNWSAYISPDSDSAVVMDAGGGNAGIYVIPLHDTTPTPRPATPVPEPTPIVEPSSPPVSLPASVVPSQPSSSPGDVVGSDTPPSASPSPSVDPLASASPSVEPSPSASTEPGASSEPTPSASTSPAASPSASPSATPVPTPTASVGVTPRPDGRIEIASDVVLVGTTAAYSPDGGHFAFTARPADGSGGPDVFVWAVGHERAAAVTHDGASLFAGWLGEDLLVSRVLDGTPRTAILALGDRSERPAHGGAMWRPAVGPGRTSGVWWDGTVKRTPDDRGWIPDAGRLVLEPWPAGEDGAQELAGSGLTDWQVDWDDAGTFLAVWTTTGAPGAPGSLSLYAVDPATGAADLAEPKLDAVPAFEGFSLRPGRLTWSAPAEGGDSTVQVLAWDGDRFGRLEIPAEEGATVAR